MKILRQRGSAVKSPKVRKKQAGGQKPAKGAIFGRITQKETKPPGKMDSDKSVKKVYNKKQVVY
ncbi:MAG: hypothetical protein PUB63_00565 [Clostridia bacterium]|nr:hypothetical protein [Clostridia bacterium]